MQDDRDETQMREIKPSARERAPFLFMGVLCWLCGAVVVGIATQFVFGRVSAAVAVAVVTVVVLGVFWSLSSSAYTNKR